jgi:hypothetical protein
LFVLTFSEDQPCVYVPPNSSLSSTSNSRLLPLALPLPTAPSPLFSTLVTPFSLLLPLFSSFSFYSFPFILFSPAPVVRLPPVSLLFPPPCLPAFSSPRPPTSPTPLARRPSCCRPSCCRPFCCRPTSYLYFLPVSSFSCCTPLCILPPPSLSRPFLPLFSPRPPVQPLSSLLPYAFPTFLPRAPSILLFYYYCFTTTALLLPLYCSTATALLLPLYCSTTTALLLPLYYYRFTTTLYTPCPTTSPSLPVLSPLPYLLSPPPLLFFIPTTLSALLLYSSSTLPLLLLSLLEYPTLEYPTFFSSTLFSTAIPVSMRVTCFVSNFFS